MKRRGGRGGEEDKGMKRKQRLWDHDQTAAAPAAATWHPKRFTSP